MNHASKSTRKRFTRFLMETSSKEVTTLQFQTYFDPPTTDPIQALLFALDKATWIIDSLKIEDGGIVLRPIEDSSAIAGWEFLVIAPDAKATSLLHASLLNGYLGEHVTLIHQSVSNRLLSEAPGHGQKWMTLDEVRRSLSARTGGFGDGENIREILGAT